MKYSDEISVSFGYLTVLSDPNDKSSVVQINQAQFDKIVGKLKAHPSYNRHDEGMRRRYITGSYTPISNVEVETTRLVFGYYKKAYTGHGYENDMKGDIPAESISSRQFMFMLYLSDNGRIHLGTQYISNFGGYSEIRKAVGGYVETGEHTTWESIRRDNYGFEGVVPQQLSVKLSNLSADSTKSPSISDSSVMVFQRPPGDAGIMFEDEVRSRIFPIWGSHPTKIKKEVAKIINENESYSIEEGDISDCSIVGKIGKRSQTFFMAYEPGLATRFGANVSRNKDGHPKFGPMSAEMVKIFKKEVLEKFGDV